MIIQMRQPRVRRVLGAVVLYTQRMSMIVSAAAQGVQAQMVSIKTHKRHRELTERMVMRS